MVLCDGSEAKPKTRPSSSQTPSKPKLPFSHSQVFPPFSFASLFSPLYFGKNKIYSSSYFYCRDLSFYLNSWANSKNSFHKHFRYIAQVPYNLLLSFLFSPAVFFLSTKHSRVFYAVRNGGFGFRRCQRFNIPPNTTWFMLSKSMAKILNYFSFICCSTIVISI